MNRQIVSHLVAGYPTVEGSLDVAKGLIDGGAYGLEVQIPFSDPSADGPVIEAACSSVLEAGFKLEQGFELIKNIKEFSPKTPLYIMSYATIVFNYGVENFVKKSKELGVDGLIIPDLIVGADEGLYQYGDVYGVDVIPVLVTSVTEIRIGDILRASHSKWVYIALRGGTTGCYTQIRAESIEFLDRIKTRGVNVMAGFGIQSNIQIQALDDHVDATVIGSFLVKKIKELCRLKADIRSGVKELIEALSL